MPKVGLRDEALCEIVARRFSGMAVEGSIEYACSVFVSMGSCYWLLGAACLRMQVPGMLVAR